MIKTGDRNFWIAQTIGWSLMTGTNLLVQYLAGYPKEVLFYNSLIPMVVGFVMTSLYRYYIKRSDWRKWDLNKTVTVLLLSTIILASTFMISVFLLVRFVYGLHALSLAAFLSNMFVFMLIFLTWNLIYFSVHYFNSWTESEIEKWQLASEIKDAQLGSLRSQIKPHFVFNTINNIRSLILEDKEKARDMLVNFSDLFRYALKNTDHSRVELSQELEIVTKYLELISIQYEDKLLYSFQVDENVKDLRVPTMMLQLLVENAVKHGISQSVSGGSILIVISKEKEVLHLKVVNTGDLTTSSSLDDQLGVGLENIRKRLELIYDGQATLEIKELKNDVVVHVKIPIS